MAVSERFSECRAVSGDRRIRQGDIFEWLKSREDPFGKIGLVVTADCDIEHEKHYGILTYVPILRLEDYLALFYLPMRVKKVLHGTKERLVKMIRGFQQKYADKFERPVSEEAGLRWVKDTGPTRIAEELQIPEGRERDELNALAEEYVLGETARQRGPFGAQTKAYVRARVSAGDDKGEAEKRLRADIETFVTNLPGDAFFIASIESGYRDGYVAYLRLLREVNERNIAIRQTDLRDTSVQAKRIAALKSPYLYSLTQQLIGVFAAIGLPEEYEEARRETLRRIAQRVKG